MRVTDSQKASLAGTLIAASFGANAALLVLSMAINRVVTPSFDGPWFIVEQLLWLASSVVTVVGLVVLSSAVEERALPQATAVVWIVMALVDLVSLGTSRLGLGAGGLWVTDLNMLVSLVGRGLVLVLLARITMESRAWMVPLLATVGVLTVARTALSVALMHQVVGRELYASPLYGLGTMAVSFFNSGAILFAAIVARSVLSGAQAVPARERAGLLVPVQTAEPVSPAADFLVGGILLAVGVGVTMVSLSVASNGGRYVVATGAIGVGLGRLIRGFIRLAKG